MTLPRIYLSSRFDTDYKIEKDFLKKTGCTSRCHSFAFIHPSGISYSKNMEEALHCCEDQGVHILMDSGAASLHAITAESARRGKVADRRQALDVHELQKQMYADYVRLCKKDKKKWDCYVTLDFKKWQPIIYEMQLQFIKDGLRPMPMYHGDHGLEWLLKYKDLGFKYIGISGRTLPFKKKRAFFDRVFSYAAKHNMVIHGMAITSLSLLTMYPWKSVDSSTWSRNASIGNILLPNPERNIMMPLHVSKRQSGKGVNCYHKLEKRNRMAVDRKLADMGFDIKELVNPDRPGRDARHIFNGWIYAHLDKIGIDLTNKRIEWEEMI